MLPPGNQALKLTLSTIICGSGDSGARPREKRFRSGASHHPQVMPTKPATPHEQVKQNNLVASPSTGRPAQQGSQSLLSNSKFQQGCVEAARDQGPPRAPRGHHPSSTLAQSTGIFFFTHAEFLCQGYRLHRHTERARGSWNHPWNRNESAVRYHRHPKGSRHHAYISPSLLGHPFHSTSH
jgi:hypothetical protein